jgi:ferredoxin-NADP reductase
LAEQTESKAAAASGANQRVIYRATVERIVAHTEEARSLFLRLPEGTQFTFMPGQFISITIPLPNETRVRPYTLASSPEDAGPLEIVFNLVPGGAGSEYLFRLGIGGQLDFTGPFGLFTLERAPQVETIFAAEATAIAPIRPMLRRALADRSAAAPLRLFYAARSRRELLYAEEFEAAASSYEHFSFEPILSEPEPDRSRAGGALLDHLKRRFVDADERRDRAFYLCGVGQGVIEQRDLLRKAGYARRAVLYERW